MDAESYLLCRPVGGLNDSLNQLEICWQYAAATHRVLILDGMFSGMLDRWERYLQIREDQVLRPVFYSDSMADRLNTLTCQPPAIAGAIDRYEVSTDGENCVEAASRSPLRFDLSRDHPEPLLVHHQYGGGTLSFAAIARLRLIPALAERIATLKAEHPSYIAVHIRNTDYQTDYEPILDALKVHPHAGEILLCSDDARCKQRAREALGERIFSSTATPDTQGRSLHANPDLDRWEQNSNALVDLAMLALADQLFLTKTTSGVYSGFSLLANFLHHHRPVLNGFLGVV